MKKGISLNQAGRRAASIHESEREVGLIEAGTFIEMVIHLFILSVGGEYV